VGLGFRRPAAGHPDDAALQIAHLLLADTEVGLLSDEIKEKRIVLRVTGAPTFPGRIRPGLFSVLAAPAPNSSLQDLEKALLEKVDLLQKEPLPESVVRAAVAQLRLTRLKRLDTPAGLAQEAARAHAEAGSWKQLSADFAALNLVTAAEVQRVAKQYFVPPGRVVVHLIAGRPVR
jgi:predicted Zn-dependent peptidase